MQSLPNLLVGLLALGLLALTGHQLRSGRALQLGRGLGPKRVWERERDPFAYWSNQALLLIGAGVMLWAALTREIPWR